MLAGGLWWTQHARERLEERFGMTVGDVIERTDPETLAMCVAGAHELRLGRLNMFAVLSGVPHANHVLTVMEIKEGPKKKKPRWRDDDDEWE